MGSDIKILVVDDDRYLLDLLIETLKTIGYNAVGVSRPREALTILRTDKFGLVITDIKMPDMDGVEFSRRVKEEHPDLPVILISGVLGSSLIHGSEAEGFLAKPFRIGQMEELIENVISGIPREDSCTVSERILVVDDDDTFRLMLMETLKLSGYVVAGARDGQEAISLLRKGGISAVISDVKMPGMDGISLTEQVKKSWPTIPVIMITGYFSSDDDPMRLDRVADGFLMKPFKIESITELLENLKNQQTPG